MKIFAPFIWLGRKLKRDFDAAIVDYENETEGRIS